MLKTKYMNMICWPLNLTIHGNETETNFEHEDFAIVHIVPKQLAPNESRYFADFVAKENDKDMRSRFKKGL